MLKIVKGVTAGAVALKAKTLDKKGKPGQVLPEGVIERGGAEKNDDDAAVLARKLVLQVARLAAEMVVSVELLRDCWAELKVRVRLG